MPPQPKIQAVERAFEIVEHLLKHDGAGVSEVAAELELPKSTVHDYLASLVEVGYVRKRGSTYSVGTQFLYVGETMRAQHRLHTAAKSSVDELSAKTGEHASLVIEEASHAVLLYTAAGDETIGISTVPGTRMKLHMTSPGKVFLAFMDETRVQTILDERGLESMTENTITDEDELFSELRSVREQGFALEDEERILGLRTVAAPILSKDDTILGVITLYGPKHRLPERRFEEEFPELLKQAANVIELNVNY